MYWNFYDDDVIIVTSLVLRHPVSQCSIVPSSFLLPSFKLHCELQEK